jgi:hypothetical protein
LKTILTQGRKLEGSGQEKFLPGDKESPQRVLFLMAG